MILRTASSSRFRSSLKQIFLTATLALSCVLPHQAHALTRGEKGGTFLLASIMLSLGKDKLGESALAKKLATLTNTDNHDLVDASVLSTYYWAWSYLYESIGSSDRRISPLISWATDLRYQATIQPLIQIAATSKIYNKLFKSVPGLTMLACSEPDCQGVCDACEYKHLVRKAPLELAPVAIQKYLDYTKVQHVISRRAAAIQAGNAREVVAQARMAAAAARQGQVGECAVCLGERLPLYSTHCPVLCNVSFLCNACNAQIRECPQRCARPAPAAAADRPRPESLIAPHIPSQNLLSNKLYHIALWEPFWTMCRQENNFLHRWGLELRKINPLVRAHISCENRHTHSICHQCKLKKIFYIHDWAKYLKRAE